MVKFFRKIRQTLIAENRISRYMMYATGEIFLVVIGILIALQVNNWNNDRVARQSEVKYLNNIILDLQKDLSGLDFLIEFRKTRIEGDKKLILQINGLAVDDITELTKNVVNTIMEERFTPNNNTYQELSNSGNLNIISNDSIKILLLQLEEEYKINRFAIDHETWDYREYISKPVISHTNLDRIYPVFTGEKSIESQKISIDDFKKLFESKEFKNGLFIMMSTSAAFIPIYENIRTKSKKIIDMIKTDLNL
jgi:hypothetical protein